MTHLCRISIALRLAGGSTPYEGRVEIFHNNIWGIVCDDYWTITEANVVCRQLFSTDAVAAEMSAYFGKGFGTIWLDDVTCNGNEERLEDCSHPGWGTHNCAQSESAGVICTSKSYILFTAHLPAQFVRY